MKTTDHPDSGCLCFYESDHFPKRQHQLNGLLRHFMITFDDINYLNELKTSTLDEVLV